MIEDYKALYQEYEDARSLLKLKNYALWTIPGAFPDVHKDTQLKGNASIEHDYQSIGAILVNNLASKLASLLFPVTQSFFKLEATDELIMLATEEYGISPEEVKARLVELENEACSALFENASYAQLTQLMRYLIITGNALYKRMDGKLTVYSLRNFTQLRDNEGTVLDVVLKEDWAYASLPMQLKLQLSEKYQRDSDVVTVYTRIKRGTTPSGGVIWTVSQQVDGIDVGVPSIYPDKLCPYNVVVWNLVNGDSNGRGLVEDHAGHFAKLSDLSRALALYEIDACKVVNLVQPGSGADVDALNNAYSGEWVQGNPGSVTAHESGSADKIQQLSATINNIFQQLAMAFMYQGNTRDAERVTAEELRRNAQEAEYALGGVYSQLSQGTHLPLSYLLCHEIDPMFITAIIANEVTLKVVTGLPALGRSTIVTQLLQAVQELAGIIPAIAELSPRFDTERIIDTVLQARGLNLEDIMLSPEALEAKQAEAAAQTAPQDMTSSIGAIQGII